MSFSLLASLALVGLPLYGASPKQQASFEHMEKMFAKAGVRRLWMGKQRIDESVLLAFLKRVQRRCPPGKNTCPATLARGPKGERRLRFTKASLLLLGKWGSPKVLPVLWRFGLLGFYEGKRAQKLLQARQMRKAFESSRCRPPSPEEVKAKLATLRDFVGIRTEGGKLVARQPTAAELRDLAYFLVASEGAGPAVGEWQEQGSGNHLKRGKPDPQRKKLYKALQQAKQRGDLKAIARTSRRFLQTLGYPGKIQTKKVGMYAWGGAFWAYAMRDLAVALELLGQNKEAAHLYRRADPGGGACGTSTPYRWKEQMAGLIRTTELLGRCRAVVPERLVHFEEEADSPYGPLRLKKAGFDLQRLYRGALVTRYRDLPMKQLRQLLQTAPARLRKAALTRLQRRGPEAWEQRVFALEGIADTTRRKAFPLLIKLALHGKGDLQKRALAAIGELGKKPRTNPCKKSRWTHFGFSSTLWNRPIRSLGSKCATLLAPKEVAQLSHQVASLLKDPDSQRKALVLRTLGQLAHPSTVRLLTPYLKSTFHNPRISRCQSSKGKLVCKPSYPLREAAQSALTFIKKRQWSPTSRPTSRPIRR